MAILHALLVGSMWEILDARLSSVIVSSHVLWGLPLGFLPATGKFINSLEAVDLFSPSHMSIPSQSALPI